MFYQQSYHICLSLLFWSPIFWIENCCWWIHAFPKWVRVTQRMTTTNNQMLLAHKFSNKSTSFRIPDAQCMEYVPTFGSFLGSICSWIFHTWSIFQNVNICQASCTPWAKCGGQRGQIPQLFPTNSHESRCFFLLVGGWVSTPLKNGVKVSWDDILFPIYDIYIYGGCPKYLFPDSPQSLSQSRSNRGTTVSNRGRVCSSLIRSYT